MFLANKCVQSWQWLVLFVQSPTRHRGNFLLYTLAPPPSLKIRQNYLTAKGSPHVTRQSVQCNGFQWFVFRWIVVVSSGASTGASSGACLGHYLGHVWGIIWGMSGACLGHIWGMSVASSGACLGHHLGHVWGIIWGIIWGIVWGMSGACLGQHLGHIVNNPILTIFDKF